MSLYSIGASATVVKKNPKEGKEGLTLAIVGGLFALIFLTPLVKQKR